jgi:cytoskeletal protein CcmA (bactofilin family)
MARFSVNPSELLSVNAMVGRGEPDGLSILAQGARVVGTVVSNGVVKIEGTVEGSIQAEKKVMVGRTGVVDGDIETYEATIGGEVRGSVTARVKVAILNGASLLGNLAAPMLMVEDGASINGTIRTARPSAGPSNDPDRAESLRGRSSNPSTVKTARQSRDRSPV